MNFHSKAPMLKYCKKSLNSCCFSSLESAFYIINHTKAANYVAIYIEESLKIQVGNCIDFVNAILKNEKRFKGEQKLYYSMSTYTTRGFFDILTDISEHVTLVQLMYSLVNVNCAISVVGYWIFDSNYEKSLVLNRESLDIICAPYVGE